MREVIIDVILRHILLFAACTVVDGELLGTVSWWILGSWGKAGVFFGVKAALLMPLHGSPKNSVAPHNRSSAKTPQGLEVEKDQPGLYIMTL